MKAALTLDNFYPENLVVLCATGFESSCSTAEQHGYISEEVVGGLTKVLLLFSC